jgi:hypothetical protein
MVKQLKQLNNHAFRATQDIRKFVLNIIRRQVTGDIILSLRPSFLIHIVNDAEIYLNLLSDYIQKNTYIQNPALISLTWLLNIYAGALTRMGWIQALLITIKGRQENSPTYS